MTPSRKIIAFILSVLMLFGGSGCMFNKHDKSDIIVNYLNEKYDDSFSFVESFGKQLFNAQSQDKFFCKSEKYPDTPITVVYDKSSKEYFDNYIAVKYSPELDSLVNDVFSSILGDYDFYYKSFAEKAVDSKCQSFDSETSFAEYISNCREFLTVYVGCENDLSIISKDFQHDLEKKIVDAGVYFNVIDVYFVDHISDSFKNDVNERTRCKIHKRYINHLKIKMKDNSSFSEVKWENEL